MGKEEMRRMGEEEEVQEEEAKVGGGFGRWSMGEEEVDKRG